MSFMKLCKPSISRNQMVLNWQADVLIYMHSLWYQGHKIEKTFFGQNQVALYVFQFYTWNYVKLQKLTFLRSSSVKTASAADPDLSRLSVSYLLILC
jgi:hypothetical protein